MMLWNSNQSQRKSQWLLHNRTRGVHFIYFPSSHKRLTQQKKQRERERKDLDTLGRRHLANVRVVQRNVVYVIGIGPRFAKEEVSSFPPS